MKKILLLATLISMLCGTTRAAENSDPFSFTSGNTTFKFGGFVLVTTGAYLEGSTTGNNFPVYSIPTTDSPYDESRFLIDASCSRMYIDVTQKTESVGDIRFYMEGDFVGSGYVIRLRQAHLTVKNILFGQTWSLMTDPAANTPTVDIQGVTSRTFFRTPMIAYHNSICGNLSYGLSAEFPSVSMTAQDDLKQALNNMPDFLGYLQTKGSMGHLRATAVWRTMSYSYVPTTSVEHLNGWGVQLSGSLKATSALTLYGQGIVGEGIARYINDLSAQSLDLVESYTSDYDMATLPMNGFSLGFRVQLTDEYAFASSYSQTNITEDGDYITDSSYKRGDYLSTVLFYYPAPNLSFGLEYLYGRRQNYDNTQGEAQRLNLMARYAF